VHALRGKEYVAWDNPCSVGMTGLIGVSSGYYAMLDCDVLLMLGTGFPYRQFYPDGHRVCIAQIDIRVESLGRRAHLELGLVGDVGASVDALLPLLSGNSDGSHLQRAREHYARTCHSLEEQGAIGTNDRHIHPQQIVAALSRLAAGDAVFSCDVGLPTVWATRHLTMNGQRRLLGSFVHGSMGNAMAQAVGAQAANRRRQVISLSGDGGFSMLMGDFLSLAQLDLPVKVIVLNNGALGFVELEQKSSGILGIGTDLENPDFAAMARGFSLYMLRAVMNGRSDEILELAADKLWR